MLASPIKLSPSMSEFVRVAKRFSAAERLFLARELLGSITVDEVHESMIDEPMQKSSPISLEEVIAQIRATPSNSQQIERASKTIDEALLDISEIEIFEPHLTTDEWEQNWWAIRLELQELNRLHELAGQ